MLQAYTTNLTVTTDEVISFSNVEVVGRSATASIGGSQISLNESGIYHVTGYLVGAPTAEGNIGVTVLLNGTPMEQTAVSATVGAGEAVSVPIDTLVSVNRCCACQAPVVITFRYTGDAGTVNLANVVAVKVR